MAYNKFSYIMLSVCSLTKVLATRYWQRCQERNDYSLCYHRCLFLFVYFELVLLIEKSDREKDFVTVAQFCRPHSIHPPVL